MLFNSLPFLAFLLATLVTFNLCPKGYRKYLLLVFSYIFYGFWDYRFCGLLLLSSSIDYWCGLKIYKSNSSKERKNFFLLSLIVNLGALGFFKYYNFFMESVFDFAALVGMSVDPVTLNIILPVGISFYTFQSLAYTFDVYRKEQEPCHNYFDFLLYVSFFPQLVAGPIERAHNLLPQLQRLKDFSWERFWDGAQLVTIGFVKKCFISDRIHPIVDNAFSNPTRFDAIVYWEGLIAFAVQIYCDFSGYTDIARGIAKWFGVDLCLNFARPYSAINIQDFWRRWHISLSSFLRDYLYIPLGGNRNGAIRRNINIFIVMFLGGLWHGANYTFILWGLMHAFAITMHSLWREMRSTGLQRTDTQASSFVSWGITLIFVLLTWVPFRSPDIGIAIQYYQGLFQFPTLAEAQWDRLAFILYLAAMVFLIDLPERKLKWNIHLRSLPLFVRVPISLVFLLVLIIALSVEVNVQPFMYFQF